MKTIALVNNKLKNIQKWTKNFNVIYFNENNPFSTFKKVEKLLSKTRVIVFDKNGFLPYLYFSKIQKVCCAYALDKEIAKLTTEHNNAPIMVLPLDFIKPQEVKTYINNYLNAKFEGGRHLVRLQIMQEPWSKATKTMKFVKNKKVVIACDHPGFALKQSIISYLLSLGYDVVDVGTDSDQSTAYSMFAIALGLCSNWAMCGIAICGTGIGISNAINKFKGLNACVCNSAEAAKLARSKYGANVLAMGARFTGFNKACKTVNAFLKTKCNQKYPKINLLGFNYDKTKFRKIKIEKGTKIPFLLK